MAFARNRQSALYGPARAKSLIDRARIKSELSTPLGDVLTFAIVSKEVVGRFIVSLLMVSFPAAILRRVGTVIVDATKRVFGRGSWSHVAQECRKVMQPFGADVNPALAVCKVPLIIRIRATILRADPTSIFRSLCAAGVSMRHEITTGVLSFQTATALCIARLKRTRCDRQFSAADAATFPERISLAWVMHAVKCCQTVERASCEVFGSA